MPTFDFGTLFAGLFNLIGGSLISKDTNKTNERIAKDTNETNQKIAAETNATNERIADKANEFNKEQSELAYKRSTASNQVAELMKAGLSQQQALQIISSGGASASMTPATASPIPAQYSENQPYQVDNTAALQGLEGFTNSISASFDNPTGGAFGAIQGNPVITDLQEFDIDWSKVGSINDLKNYAKNSKDDKLKDYINSAKFRAASRFLPSRRFIESEFRTSMQNSSINAQIEDARQRVALGISQVHLADAHAELVVAQKATEEKRAKGQDITNQIYQLNYNELKFEDDFRQRYGAQLQEYRWDELTYNHEILKAQAEKAKRLTELEINSMSATLEKTIEQMNLDLKGIKDPEYQRLYVENILKEEELRNALIYGQLYQQQVEQAFNESVPPWASALVKMFGAFFSSVNALGGSGLSGIFFKNLFFK